MVPAFFFSPKEVGVWAFFFGACFFFLLFFLSGDVLADVVLLVGASFFPFFFFLRGLCGIFSCGGVDFLFLGVLSCRFGLTFYG